MKTVRWTIAALLVLAALTGCSLFQKRATLAIVNDSSHDITVVNISPEDDTSWGEDYLAGTLVSGGTDYFEDIRAGTYDLRARDASANEWTFYGAVLEPDEVWTWTLLD